MQEILELITKTYGLVGVFLILPMLACIVLWRDNKAMREESKKAHEAASKHIQDCNNAVVESQKQRVADAQAISAKLIEMVSEQASLNKETILSLDRISDTLTGLKYEAKTNGKG